ncbi:MAG: GNAT family N-acetyltransferase [Chloroflexota bacterium]|nr:GNAT family N-acetyltransferase [Chloroflexota bacterium]
MRFDQREPLPGLGSAVLPAAVAGDHVVGTEDCELSAKQLCMVVDAAGVWGMPDVAVPPEGYAIRKYRRGDEGSLAGTLQAVGFRDCGVDRVLETLADADRRAGSAVVEFEGRIVASTFASRMSSDRVSPVTRMPGEPLREGVLDYVATHPDHQGRGLGRATCTAVSRYLAAQGCEMVSLLTDDWRLPAIHLYLSLGFEPVMNREDMPGRWAGVLHELERHGHADA